MAEQLHITALVVSTWSGNEVHEERIEGEALTVGSVAAAVTALDGEARNDAYLEAAGDATLVVAGGPELCFIYATFDNTTFLVPESGHEGESRRADSRRPGRDLPGRQPGGQRDGSRRGRDLGAHWRVGHAGRLARDLDGDYR